MASYIKYLFKTVRKFFGEAVVVTQEVDDIISSPVVKETIINNSDCKILLDCSCDFPSYLSFPHGLLEMKRGYSSCPVIFYIQKVNAQS